VRTAFCQLHSRGLIKRERRPVETVDKGIVSDQDQWFLHCDKMNMELLDFMNNEKVFVKKNI
jgi:hypothetical protein